MRAPAKAQPVPPASPNGPCIAVLRGRVGDHLRVSHPSLGEIEAPTTVAFTASELAEAIACSARVVLTLCDQEWVVTGLIRSLPSEATSPAPSKEELVLHSDKRIVLRCGEASLTLTRDGRVLLRGKDVLSRARETNQISGGTVRLN